MDDAGQGKPLFTLFLCSVMILSAATAFAVIGDAPHTLALAAVGLGASFIIRRPLARTTRTYVYSAVAVVTLTVLQNQIFPVEAARFFLLPAELYCPALIFLGTAMTFYDQRESGLVTIMGTALLSLMLAGNTLGALDANTRFPIGNGALGNLHAFYTVCASLQLIALLLLLARADHRLAQGHYPARFRLRRRLILGFALVLVVGGGLGLRSAALRNASSLQGVFQQLFQRYMASRRAIIVFSQDVDLWRTVPMKRRSDRAVVLRVAATQSPGYLRGRAYDRYAGGHWTTNVEETSLISELPPGNVTFTIYGRPGYPPGPDPVVLDVMPAANFRSQALLVPGTVCEVDIVADDLVSDGHGSLFMEDWEMGGGYTVRARPYVHASSYPRPLLTAPYDELFTGVPEALGGRLGEIWDAILPAGEGLDTRGAIEALVRHFRSEYSYELGQRMSGGEDPVLQFLEGRKKGHCELFASSAALLLRERGIPTRYITGFVCGERHPFGGYWLARLEDAHAWVEAYVAEEDVWVLVEATPPGGIPSGKSRLNRFTALSDRVAMFWKQLIALLKRGYAAAAILMVFWAVVRSAWWFLFDPLRFILLAMLAVSCLWLWRYRRQRRLMVTERHFCPTVCQLRASLRCIERFLLRQGVERASAETIREFRARVAAEVASPHGSGIAELLGEYELLRYRQTPISSEQALSFGARAREVLRRRS